MRLERQQNAELEKRKGSAVKTIIQIIWLGLNSTVAYFLITYMIKSEEINFSYGRVYQTLLIPRSIPQWVVLAAMIITFVLVMQVFLSLGFIVASPEGRRKTGNASLHTYNKEHAEERRY